MSNFDQRRASKTYNKSDIPPTQLHQAFLSTLEHEEVFNREGYKHIYVHDQVGFEFPGLIDTFDTFLTTDYSNEVEIPLGLFIFFFGKENSSEWRAEKINQIQMRPLNFSFSSPAIEPRTPIGSDWLSTLSSNDGLLSIGNPIETVNPNAVLIISKENNSQNHFPINSFHSANKDLNIELKTPDDNSSIGDYEVFDILGYRPDMKVAFLGFDTIRQLYLAYHATPSPEDLRFIFTGAEINHGEMVSPRLQEMRFTDWKRSFDTLDPSICSTLKIEILSHKNSNGRYVKRELYSGVQAMEKLELPSVFVLHTCKRYWETPRMFLQACEINRKMFIENKFSENKRIIGYKKFLKALSIDAIKRLIENNDPIAIPKA
ncbi:hypothetical protein [Neolewinella agarilytica]|uniref:Uncharacterized protein n=1 Tax=Neolewinella agarilytica TaxID=478744 RepID=A0A1H9H8X4_9BACT|nr:hypothetical protein [Neolewinella agarilytica]SEQ58688.1 hypothetical protein SAMN05444359_11260 [Neolewinella agarilytica]